jgi:hypothetical protein
VIPLFFLFLVVAVFRCVTLIISWFSRTFYSAQGHETSWSLLSLSFYHESRKDAGMKGNKEKNNDVLNDHSHSCLLNQKREK